MDLTRRMTDTYGMNDFKLTLGTLFHGYQIYIIAMSTQMNPGFSLNHIQHVLGQCQCVFTVFREVPSVCEVQSIAVASRI